MNKTKIITLIFSISCCHALQNKRYDIHENEGSANVKYACNLLSEQREHSLEFAKAALYLLINGKINDKILNELNGICDQENIKKLNSFVGIGGEARPDGYKLIESSFKEFCKNFDQETVSFLLSIYGNGENREFFDLLFRMNWINGVFDNKDVNKINSRKRTEKHERKHPSKKEDEAHNRNRLPVKSPEVPNDLKNKTPTRTPQVPISSPKRPEAQITVEPEVQINKNALRQELEKLKADLMESMCAQITSGIAMFGSDTESAIRELMEHHEAYKEIKKAIAMPKYEVVALNKIFSALSEEFSLGNGLWSEDLPEYCKARKYSNMNAVEFIYYEED